MRQGWVFWDEKSPFFGIRLRFNCWNYMCMNIHIININVYKISIYIYRDIRVCVYMYKYVLGCYCYKETSGKFITKHLPKYRRQVRSPPNRR